MRCVFPLVVLLSCERVAAEPSSAMLHVFDSIAAIMEGADKFDRTEYRKLERCMVHYPPLRQSQDRLWTAIIQYMSLGRSAESSKLTLLVAESGSTLTRQKTGLKIAEPCSFASNLAFYHTVRGVCNYRNWNLPRDYVAAIVETTANLAAGSSLYHGSGSVLGSQMDTFMIGLLAYLLHQAALAGLTGLPSQLTHLTAASSQPSAHQISKEVVKIFQEESEASWPARLASLSVPPFNLTFPATASTIASLLLPQQAVDSIVPIVMQSFGLPQTSQIYIREVYLPLLRKDLEPVNARPQQLQGLFLRMVRAAGKLLSAFLARADNYQLQLLTSPALTQIAAQLESQLEVYSRELSQLPTLSPRLAAEQGVYPGEFWCQLTDPHSVWHVKAANGLLDYFLMIDYFYTITKKS